MLPSNHQHPVIYVSIVVDEKVNKLGHEDLLLTEVSRKGGDAGGIPSLCSSIGRVCRLVEALSHPKINSECAHEVGCSVESAASPIDYRSRSFCVTEVPTPIFVLFRFASFFRFVVVPTGKLLVDLGGGSNKQLW